jgi:cellulose synthase/poly-beta-1,6-N-acetylglucosamine synthase-like glycosyltransferase
MPIVSIILLSIYLIALGYITLFCLMQFHLLYHYKKYHNSKHPEPEPLQDHEWPAVTIQLPIFNEMYVVERLIDNICELDYPSGKMSIQVLDDSTDETHLISLRKVEEYASKGYNIELIRREDREGYKAGALKYGMQFAKGDYIAIFDADFLPPKDFLKRTIPYFFQDPKIGVVQTKWGHLNQDYSLITRLQAFQLNVHFTVEQTGRYSADHLLQFNGTAGIWRVQTIEEAGGWEADTLTEDLDLSIRAQLKGWKILFREDIESPAELPAEMNGLKSQQFRWMKGGAETARKMLPLVWRSQLSFSKKLHTTIHLLSSGIFLFIFLVGIISVPLVFILKQSLFPTDFFSLFLVGLLSIILVYYVANVQSSWKGNSLTKNLIKFLILFPVFLSLSMGLSLHNSIAVIQGYMGKRSPFIRTPKFNIQHIKDKWSKSKYKAGRVPWSTYGEGALAIYFVGGVIAGILVQDTTFLIFHTLLALGYGAIFFFSIRHLSMK